MRRKRATTAVLVTSFASVAGEQTTRSGGLGSSHAADQRGGEESVSAEPLVYTADEEPWRDDPPRERTLEEARIRGGDFSWMEDYDISGEENAEHEHILAQEYDRIGGYEAPRFDSEFDPDAWALEDQDDLGGGIEKVGAPLEFGQPIARRLRRPGPAGSHDIAYDEEVEDQFDITFEDVEEVDLTPFLEHEEEPDRELAEDYEEASPDEEHRRLNTCDGDKKRVRIEMKIGNDRPASWMIKRANNSVVTKGGPYVNGKKFNGGICLNPGTYRVVAKTVDGKGMSCQGSYNVYVGGKKTFTSPSSCNSQWKTRSHTFTIKKRNNGGSSSNNQSRPVSAPAPAPAPRPSGNAITSSAKNGCSNVKIQFKIDKYGQETNVILTKNGGGVQLQSNKDVGAYQTKTLQKCVPPGTYTFKLLDADGICCNHGQGWYKMSVNNQPVVSGGYFIGQKSHTVKIGTNWQSSMSARDKEWLQAHNNRRRKYNGGKGYVPLRWSTTLENQARSYANTLANKCFSGGTTLVHAKGLQDGENLALNKGSGSWGNLPTADKVMGRWVENELTWAYPKNAHYTQVVWRSTHYVGCGESLKTSGNQKCRVQVCRYTRPGNCNVKNGNWRAEAWKDATRCGRDCPQEGCFA